MGLIPIRAQEAGAAKVGTQEPRASSSLFRRNRITQDDLGVVTRENGAARVDDLLELDVGEGPVSDVSWSTALDLVALVRGGQQDSGLYAMRIDGVTTGRLVSTSGLPGPPSAVAAAPALPLLTIAAGDVWRTLASNEPWTRVTRDASPGSAPAYPG